jgi:hypothetical protein
MTLQHGNMLIDSVADTIALAQAVEERFLDLCGSWIRVRGVEMPIPASLDADLLRWRECLARFRKGDFRNSEAELKSTKVVAQFTLDMNASLRNQQPKKLACLEV